MTPVRSMSVRELVAELARVEDAIRRTPTFVAAAPGRSPVNPDLMALGAREKDVIAALRRYRDQGRRRPLPDAALPTRTATGVRPPAPVTSL